MGQGKSSELGAGCVMRKEEQNVEQHTGIHCPWCMGATFSTPSGRAELCKHVEGGPGVEARVMSLYEKGQWGLAVGGMSSLHERSI